METFVSRCLVRTSAIVSFNLMGKWCFFSSVLSICGAIYSFFVFFSFFSFPAGYFSAHGPIDRSG
jgi:Sec-independent protein secretion pathway component TatC